MARTMARSKEQETPLSPPAPKSPPVNAQSILRVIEAIDFHLRKGRPILTTTKEQNDFFEQLISAKRLEHPKAAHFEGLGKRHNHVTMRIRLRNALRGNLALGIMAYKIGDEAINQLFRMGSSVLSPEYRARLNDAREDTPSPTGYRPPYPATDAVSNDNANGVGRAGSDAAVGSATGPVLPVNATPSLRVTRSTSVAAAGAESREATHNAPVASVLGRSTRGRKHSAVDLTDGAEPEQDRRPSKPPPIAEEETNSPKILQMVQGGAKGKGKSHNHGQSSRQMPASKQPAVPSRAQNVVPSTSAAPDRNVETPSSPPPSDPANTRILSMGLDNTIATIHGNITAATNAFFINYTDENAMRNPATYAPPNLANLYIKTLCGKNDRDWKPKVTELQSLRAFDQKPFFKALIWTFLRINVFDKGDMPWEASSLYISPDFLDHFHVSARARNVDLEEMQREASMSYMNSAVFRRNILKGTADELAYDLMLTLAAHIAQMDPSLVPSASWISLQERLKDICSDALLLGGRLKTTEVARYAVKTWARIRFANVHMQLDPDSGRNGDIVAFTTRPALVLIPGEVVVSQALVMLLPGEDDDEDQALAVTGGEASAEGQVAPGDPAAEYQVDGREAQRGPAGDETTAQGGFSTATGRTERAEEESEDDGLPSTGREEEEEDQVLPSTGVEENAAQQNLSRLTGEDNSGNGLSHDSKTSKVTPTPRAPSDSPLSSSISGASLDRAVGRAVQEVPASFIRSEGPSPESRHDEDNPVRNTKQGLKRSGIAKESTVQKRAHTSKKIRKPEFSIADENAAGDSEGGDDDEDFPAFNTKQGSKRSGSVKESESRKRQCIPATRKSSDNLEDAAEDAEGDDGDDDGDFPIPNTKQISKKSGIAKEAMTPKPLLSFMKNPQHTIFLSPEDAADDEGGDDEIIVAAVRKSTTAPRTDMSNAPVAHGTKSLIESKDTAAARKQSGPRQDISPDPAQRSDARQDLKRKASVQNERNVKRHRAAPEEEAALRRFEWDGATSEVEDFDNENDEMDASEAVDEAESVNEGVTGNTPEATDSTDDEDAEDAEESE